MKTIIAFTHLVNDSQITLIRKTSLIKPLKLIEISTNKLDNTQLSLMANGPEIKILYKGRIIEDPVFWFATNHRCDAVYALNSRFPNESRLNALQFINDLVFACSKITTSYPGTLFDICKSDSKPYLLSVANKLGLLTPSTTINSTFRQKKTIYRDTMYKKKLGYPTFISFDRDKNKEVIVETVNTLESESSSFEGLWQWQTPVESIAHIRCFAHKNLIKSKIWHRESVADKIIDFRQTDGKNHNWAPFELPTDIDLKIKEMLSMFGLSFACPEFLMNTNGEIVFIDLNPCGDWIGFFEDKLEQDEISKLIVATLIS